MGQRSADLLPDCLEHRRHRTSFHTYSRGMENRLIPHGLASELNTSARPTGHSCTRGPSH